MARLHELRGLLHAAGGEHAAAREACARAVAAQEGFGADIPPVAHHQVRLTGAHLDAGADRRGRRLCAGGVFVSIPGAFP